MNKNVIYKIIFPNGKLYIGQAKDFSDRKRNHKAVTFNSNIKDYYYSVHCAIRKYGWENIIWEVIEDNILQEDLDKKEIYYINFYNSYNDGYNETLGGLVPMRGRQHIEESNRKNSEAHKGKHAGEKHPMWGKHHTLESIEKISQSKKGQIPWNKGIKMGPAWNKGIPCSESLREKLSILNGGKPFNVYDKITGNFIGTWINKNECARRLNLLSCKITCCLLGKRKSHHGYIFKFVNNNNVPPNQ